MNLYVAIAFLAMMKIIEGCINEDISLQNW